MCRIERWSTRTLEKKIQGMLFERTAISKKPDKLIRHELDHLRTEDKLTPDMVFRDPYFLDFLGLKDRFLEKDIEDAIMREMELFILETKDRWNYICAGWLRTPKKKIFCHKKSQKRIIFYCDFSCLSVRQEKPDRPCNLEGGYHGNCSFTM